MATSQGKGYGTQFILMICDHYIHKTDLADLSSFKRNLKIFTANIEIFFAFRIREFTT